MFAIDLMLQTFRRLELHIRFTNFKLKNSFLASVPFVSNGVRKNGV